MKEKLPTIVGLIIALSFPLLPYTPIFHRLGYPETLAERMLGQLYYLVIITSLLTIVVFWEKRPLSSIGLKPPTLATLLWAVASAIVMIKIIAPTAMWLVSKTGLPLFEGGLKVILALPLWFRLLATVITGGLFEEITRAFLVERLSELTGSYWVGGFLAVSAFAWIHYPLWGLGPVLTFYITGGFLTGLYLWRHDLWVTMLCHILVDGVGLILAPPL